MQLECSVHSFICIQICHSYLQWICDVWARDGGHSFGALKIEENLFMLSLVIDQQYNSSTAVSN